MIRNRAEYNYYIESDRKSLNIKRKNPWPVIDYIWKYQRLLRKVEYYQRYKERPFLRIYYYWLYFRLKRQGTKYGFQFFPNQFGPGLSIAHIGPIIINSNARIGKNCRIHVGVNIGVKAGGSDDEVPIIGDNVYIGPGAKIFGAIQIADGIAIGANAVVNKSFNESNITIGGIPACKISDKGSKGLIIEGAE